MKICPRCKRKCLEEEAVLNSISHVGDNVEICSICGQEQGNVGLYNNRDPVEELIEQRFRKKIRIE